MYDCAYYLCVYSRGINQWCRVPSSVAEKLQYSFQVGRLFAGSVVSDLVPVMSKIFDICIIFCVYC